jgi:hypothetical protein
MCHKFSFIALPLPEGFFPLLDFGMVVVCIEITDGN